MKLATLLSSVLFISSEPPLSLYYPYSVANPKQRFRKFPDYGFKIKKEFVTPTIKAKPL